MYSIVDLAGSIGQDTFVFTSPYLSQDHIHVYIAGVEELDFTFSGAFTIILDTPLVAAATVRVRRFTPIDEPVVDFTNGSVLGETDLDASALQLLYATQEGADQVESTLVLDNNSNFDARGFKIVNLGDPENLQDAVTKRYADDQSGTAEQQAAVEAAQAAAAEAALTLADILGIDLTNVTEFMRTVLAAETAVEARDTLGALSGTGAELENPIITGTVTGVYTLETPSLSGDVTGGFNLVEPEITDPLITGDISGTPNFLVTPTFTTPLPGTVTVGVPVIMNPYTVSSTPQTAHTLGDHPSFLTWYLECLDSEHSYSVGDRVTSLADSDTSSSVNRGFSIGANDTNSFVTSTGSVPRIVSRATLGGAGITAAKWKLVVTPFLVN